MLVLLISVAHGALDSLVYSGNWSVREDMLPTVSSIDRPGFQVTLKPVKRQPNITFIRCSISFDDIDNDVLSDIHDMTGIIAGDGEFGLCYRPAPNLNFTASCLFLEQILNEMNVSLSTDYLAHEFIAYIMEHKSVSTHQSAFGFVIGEGEAYQTYDLPSRLNGTYSINNEIELLLSGTQFNLRMFVSESRIFGVWMAAVLAFEFYGWAGLVKVFSTNTRQKFLSPHSLMMYIGFDISVGFVLFVYFSVYSVYLIKLYVTLFISTIGTYFLMKMHVLVVVWKANNGGEVADVNRFRLQILFFFAETYTIMAVTATAACFVFTNPFPNLLLLYSFWLPQIWHMMWNNYRSDKLIPFIIILSCSKTFLLVYGSFYKYSIMSGVSPVTGTIFLFYFWLQVLLLVLQCLWGGSFFLPRCCKKPPFDYQAERPLPGTECPICMSLIEDTERAMVTPCGHGFHRACLLQWMEQDMICPVCRTELPFVSGRE